MLTTEECLLSKTQERNPGFTRSDYEEMFRNYLGIRKVLWLNRGIAGDDTHGHVDDLARFVNPTTVVTVVEENSADENYAPLRENLERLKAMTDQDGHRLRVETLPMPKPIYFDGQRLPASYANFYIANGIVIVPTFNDLERSRGAEQTCRTFSRSRSHRRRMPRSCSWPGDASLHDATATRGSSWHWEMNSPEFDKLSARIGR